MSWHLVTAVLQVVVLFGVFAVLGLVIRLLEAGEISHLPSPVVKPEARKETVSVRYLDVRGRVLWEEAIDVRLRRPTRTWGGMHFVAAGLKDGVWEYRWTGAAQ